MNKVAIVITAVAVSLFFLTGQVYPQQDQVTTRRVAVTVALVERVPYPNALAVILRRSSTTPHDVILLEGSSARAGYLAAAVVTLLATRRIQGDTASTSAVLRVGKEISLVQGEKLLVEAEGVVSHLRSTPPREVAGVGVVRARQVWLPPSRSRRSS